MIRKRSAASGHVRLIQTSLLALVLGSGSATKLWAAQSDDQTVQLDTINVQGPATDLQSPIGPGIGFVATRSAAGTKTDTPIVETPQSISVVTQEQIEVQGAQSINQALAYTAGVQTAPYGYDARYDQFLIRGFTASQFGNYRDGLRQGNGLFAFFRNDPYDLERIEVLKGPTSVLYGGNEAGGLINLVSKMPVPVAFGEAGVDIGNYDRYQGRFDFGAPLDQDGRFLYRLTGLVRDSGTQVWKAPDDRVNLSPALTAHLTDDTTVTVLGNVAHNRNSMWPYYLNIPGRGVSRIRVGDPEFDKLDQDQWSLGYRLEHRFSDNLLVRQNFRVGQVDFSGGFVDADRLAADGVTLNRYAGQWIEHLTTINLDNQAQAKLVTGPVGHTVLTGIDYFHQEFSSQMKLGTAPSLNLIHPVYSLAPVNLLLTTYNTFQTLDQVGVYGQDQMSFGGFRLSLGGREDFVDQSTKNYLAGTNVAQSPTHFTGRAGLLYLFDNGVAPYVSYATSFLPTSGTTSPARGSTPFAPTSGELYEGGVKYQPPGLNALITASVFQISKDNVTTTDPNNRLYSVQTGQVRSRGFEIEGTMALAEGLNGIASYSYTDVKVTKSNNLDLGKVPVGVPKNQAAIFLDYTVPYGQFAGLGGGAGVRLIDNTWADTANTQLNPSIFAVDLAAHYSYQHIKLEVSARNILDQEVGICNSGNCTFSQGRTVLGSLVARF